MAQYKFYVVCKKSGKEEIQFFADNYAKKQGGIEALESELRKQTQWYQLIGTLDVPHGATDCQHPDFPGQGVVDLIGMWVEQGYPRTAGNIVPTPAAKRRAYKRNAVWSRRYFFYMVCERDGLEEVAWFPESQVLENGGRSGLETMISEHTIWFFPLGDLELPFWVEKPKGIQIPLKQRNELVDEWKASGSPKTPGKLKQEKKERLIVPQPHEKGTRRKK